MENIKLVWLGMQEVMPGVRVSMWDVVKPQLPGYDYKYGYPTMSKEALLEAGLITLKEITQ